MGLNTNRSLVVKIGRHHGSNVAFPQLEQLVVSLFSTVRRLRRGSAVGMGSTNPEPRADEVAILVGIQTGELDDLGNGMLVDFGHVERTGAAVPRPQLLILAFSLRVTVPRCHLASILRGRLERIGFRLYLTTCPMR